MLRTQREHISLTRYFIDCEILLNKIVASGHQYDAIVCLKRSGFMLGAYLSNQLSLPLFTTSETASIPGRFYRVLVVDDKVCTGKSVKHIRAKLVKLDKHVSMACLYTEREGTDFSYLTHVVEHLGSSHKMFYEVNMILNLQVSE